MAMDIRRYALVADGITPLVMNNNSVLLNGNEDKGRDPAAWEREHFLDKAYAQPDGGLFVPGAAIRKSLIVATKYTTKKPKGVAFKSYGPVVEGALLIDDDARLVGKTLDDLQRFTSVVNLDPSKGPRGPRGPRTRPRLPLKWQAETTLTVMDDLLTTEILAEIVDLAGKRCGWLDGRSINYGRAFVRIAPLAA